MNILKELYYGNIDPQQRGYRAGSQPKKRQAELSELEEKLSALLTGEEKNTFLTYVKVSGKCLNDAALDSFLVGFRLGARFAFDTFASDDAPFEDF